MINTPSHSFIYKWIVDCFFYLTRSCIDKKTKIKNKKKLKTINYLFINETEKISMGKWDILTCRWDFGLVIRLRYSNISIIKCFEFNFQFGYIACEVVLPFLCRVWLYESHPLSLSHGWTLSFDLFYFIFILNN